MAKRGTEVSGGCASRMKREMTDNSEYCWRTGLHGLPEVFKMLESVPRDGLINAIMPNDKHSTNFCITPYAPLH